MFQGLIREFSNAQVFAQRRHSLQAALSYEDEVAALLSLLLDRHSLATGSASFADSLYGLRRAPYVPYKGNEPSKPAWLSVKQQRLALLSLVSPFSAHWLSNFLRLLPDSRHVANTSILLT